MVTLELWLRLRLWSSILIHNSSRAGNMADSLLPGISPGGAGDANGWR
jgi:hypothetical protein|tara:strand:- start:319 stop:462 length:144 start_codon:yes stop_codon:yes gene_type:complete